MVKIRKLCDDMYGELEEPERLAMYSRPKLERLVDLLRGYGPETSKDEQGAAEEKKEEATVQQQVVTRRRGGGRRAGSTPEDPDTLCALLIVSTAFSAKILYHYLKDLSRARPELSFLCPQYAVADPIPADPRDVESERRKARGSFEKVPHEGMQHS